MASTGDVWSEMQQRQLDVMKQFQESVTQTMKTWTDAVMPGAAGGAEGQPAAPWADLPTPAQVADGYFKFAEEMLSRQHEFAMTLIESLTPKPPAS